MSLSRSNSPFNDQREWRVSTRRSGAVGQTPLTPGIHRSRDRMERAEQRAEACSHLESDRHSLLHSEVASAEPANQADQDAWAVVPCWLASYLGLPVGTGLQELALLKMLVNGIRTHTGFDHTLRRHGNWLGVLWEECLRRLWVGRRWCLSWREAVELASWRTVLAPLDNGQH